MVCHSLRYDTSARMAAIELKKPPKQRPISFPNQLEDLPLSSYSAQLLLSQLLDAKTAQPNALSTSQYLATCMATQRPFVQQVGKVDARDILLQQIMRDSNASVPAVAQIPSPNPMQDYLAALFRM